MDSSQVLSHLQLQFSGQLVLYVDDIAKVLGKSEKAISNLIARKNLPFKIKAVGGHRCVDIFQVAQWLSSDAEMSEDIVKPPLAALKPLQRPSKSPGRSASVGGATSGNSQPKTAGLMVSEILRMRHDYAGAMERFVFGLRDSQDLAFMHEVVEKLFFASDLLASSYVVTIKKLAPANFKLRGEETIKYFDTQARACDFLLARLGHARTAKSKYVMHLDLSRSDESLFHVIINASQFAVVSNAIGIDLPGL